MRTNTRKNRGGKRNQKDRRIKRSVTNNPSGGTSQLVEIEFEKAVSLILSKTRPGEQKNRLLNRIRKVLDTYEKGKLNTYEDYGYTNYLDAEKGKVTASYGEKRPDVRVTEVNLAGEEAHPVTYTVPQHPLELVDVNELEIVTEGLIHPDKVTEAKEFVQSDKFDQKNKLDIPLVDGITDIDAIKVRDVIQLLCTGKSIVTVNNGKITIRKFDGIRDKRPNSWLWPKRYVKFVLHRNMRSPVVLDTISKKLGLQTPDKFIKTHLASNAGYTFQFMEVEKMCPTSLRDAFERENCFVSNIDFVDTTLEKNDYLGLRTKICLRDVKMTGGEIAAAMDHFKDTGYINYFHVTVSHLRRHALTNVGKLIVKGELVEAMEQVVFPRPLERNKWELIRQLFYASGNANIFHPLCKSIQAQPNDIQSVIFRNMIQASKGTVNTANIEKIINGIDVSFLIEYVDLFLGQIWNQTLNKIIDERGGLTLDIGDLVFADDDAECRITQEYRYSATIPRSEYKEDEPSFKTAVKTLTDADIESGKYSIYDMVLPVPGFDVVYPENDVKDWFTKSLQAAGIDRGVEWFDLIHKSAEKTCPVTFRGTYRKVALKPESFNYTTATYQNANAPLVLTDVPRQVKAIRKKEEEKKAEDGKNETEKYDPEKAIAEDDEMTGKDKSESGENGVKKDEKGENGVKKEEEGANKDGTTAEVKKEEAAKPQPEPKTALILDFFVPRGTSHILALRELFKKNDFGNLNTPYERILDKREIDRLQKKMKLVLKEVQNIKPQRYNNGGSGSFNEPSRFDRQSGGFGGGDRFKRGRDSYGPSFNATPLHDPFGRGNDFGGRGSNLGGRGYLNDPYGSSYGSSVSSGIGSYSSAPFGRSHDPAIDRLEMLEREIATLRQGMQSNNGVGSSIGGNRALEDARGLFTDLRPYERNTLSASSFGGGGNSFNSGNIGNSSGVRGYNDDLPSLKRLCPDFGRGNPEQSFNDRFGSGKSGNGYGRKFY